MEQSRAAVREPPLQPNASPPTAAPASAHAPAPLEYDRSPTHVTRGQFRILLFMMFINTVAIVGYVCVPGGSQWARQAWKDFETRRTAKAAEKRKADAQAKRVSDFYNALPAAMATVKIPADAPVYTEDGLEAASLLASDSAYRTVRFERRGMDVHLWQAAVGRGASPAVTTVYSFIGGNSGSNIGFPVFFQTRKNPAGADRLIFCELDASQQMRSIDSDGYTIGSERTLTVRLYAPGSAKEPPNLLAVVQTGFDQRPAEQAKVKSKGGGSSGYGSGVKTPQTFRLMSGVADPSDATRLTIPYLINGARGAFAVRIVAGDQLIVEPSDGRIAERNGSGTRVTQLWDPSAVATMRVSEGRP
jgi:hypothetical protein